MKVKFTTCPVSRLNKEIKEREQRAEETHDYGNFDNGDPPMVDEKSLGPPIPSGEEPDDSSCMYEKVGDFYRIKHRKIPGFSDAVEESDSNDSTSQMTTQMYYTSPGYVTGFVAPNMTRCQREGHLETLELRQQDHDHKKDTMITKQQLLAEKLRFMEDLKFRAELATRTIVVTPDDTLLLAIYNAEGHLYGDKRICNAKNLRLTAFHCSHGYGPEWIFEVSWDVGKDKNEIYISFDDMEPEYLIKTLKKSGVVIQRTKANAEIVAALLYSHLFTRSEVKELPRKQGWYLTDGKWEWCKSDELTMLEVMKRCR